MVYNTSLLVSLSQCDAYLNEINTELNELNYRKSVQQVSIDTNATIATTIPGQLQISTDRLTDLQAQLASATDTSEQSSLQVQINSMENRIIRLQNRQAELASAGLIDRQLAVARLEADMAVWTAFKTAIEARKTELQSPASAA
jgi:chromosome segregation ATPase